MHLVIGTAGHVDHGKTALVRVLTGQDTDRLPEEKARGISIDIGFAQFRLPSGRKAAIVDVPGHERFIKNMLAGVTGIDLVLLVVAADEGVMPQTREHLDILRLLEVKKGLVAVTKKDLVDPDWLELVKEEIAGTLRGTFLEGAPMLAVSSVTGEGVAALEKCLDDLMAEVEARDVSSFPRLPIDRIFTSQGFGTIVTGTLISGTIKPEDRLEILPAGREVRVRGLQVHGEKVGRAEAGQRTAVNLGGVDRYEIQRGDVLVQPGMMRPSQALAVKLHILESWSSPFKNGSRVHFHTGTAEVLARVTLLDRDELKPGETAYAQVRCEKPVVAGRRDHFIIRFYSPVTTIGGGIVVEPAGRYKRFSASALEELKAKEAGGPEELAAAVLEKSGVRPLTTPEVARAAGLTDEAAAHALQDLAGRGETLSLGETFIHRRGYHRLKEEIGAFLGDFYGSYPLRRGVSREELRRRVLPQSDSKIFNAILERLSGEGFLAVERDKVALSGREVRFTPDQARARDELERRFKGGGFSPPSLVEAAAGLKVSGTTPEEILQYLIDAEAVVKISEDLGFHRAALEEARRRTTEFLTAHGKMTMADFRDLLGTTRKYAVPLLEYFDAVKLTRRVGDERILMFSLDAGETRNFSRRWKDNSS
ncbi:MAG: selenocysteine-specific translation elongation factor [Actinobacteria bacterium]|nr:selenocysteine-specific translation elongation factor [Actinomycetota bacterium]